MVEVGRNDPCPCGSGKKYKRCCGAPSAADPQAAEGFHRTSAIEKLMRFALSSRFEEATSEGIEDFWDGVPEELDESQEPLLEKLAQVWIGLQLYLALDMEIEPDRAIVDLFLEQRGYTLTSTERQVLETLGRSRLSIYEIREVVRDEGLRLRDLWRGGEFWLSERSATHTLQRWQVIVVRVTSWPGERLQMEGEAWVFGPDQGPPLLELLREQLDQFREVEPELTDEAFLRELATLVNPIWLRTVAFPAPPNLQNTDGDELVATELSYRVADPDSMAQAIGALDDMETVEDREWVWLARRGEERITLGHLVLEGDELFVEVNSREREERLRAILAGLGEGLAEPVQVDRFDPREDLAAGREGAELDPEPSQLDAAEATPEGARAVHEAMDRHYRSWVDEEIPALGGRTPRQAARDPAARETLVGLLKQIETMEGRRAQAGVEPYDPSWMWTELGVEA